MLLSFSPRINLLLFSGQNWNSSSFILVQGLFRLNRVKLGYGGPWQLGLSFRIYIRLLTYWKQKICHLKPVLDHFLRLCNGSTNNFVAFLLNPSANSDLLCLTQTYGSFVIEQTMYLARTFIFSLHRDKLKLTGRWPNYF